MYIIFKIYILEEEAMKLATFGDPGAPRAGIVHGDGRVFDLAAADPTDSAFKSMLDLIDGGPAALDRARDLFERKNTEGSFTRELSDVQLLAPVPVPRQMRDCSLFPPHIRQAPRGMLRLRARAAGDEKAAAAAQALPDVPPVYKERPIYYITNRYSVIGPDATVRWPRYSKVMDFELEIGMFLWKGGANIPADKAREHIFGYTIYNDFSARDEQSIEMQGMLGPAKGKSFDGGNAIGPWIVTADEIPDVRALSASARVNGETWTKTNANDMLFSVEEVIAFISRDETLHAGEFIGTGTLGNGCGLELDRYLKHGDVVELEVEKIGVLRNRVERQDV
jgi:2-keto-4-pentenoate hydratase/2-oxohepta-3-ene-1,7-dioic acid hydratase in catechol pathway